MNLRKRVNAAAHPTRSCLLEFPWPSGRSEPFLNHENDNLRVDGTLRIQTITTALERTTWHVGLSRRSQERLYPTPSLRNGSENRKFAPSEAWRLAWRRKGMILTLAILGALVGFVATKTLTPRYVATAQIYLDPHGLPGLEKEDFASHEDFDRLHKLRRDPGENSYLPRRA